MTIDIAVIPSSGVTIELAVIPSATISIEMAQYGLRGLQGEQGADASLFSVTAAESIGGHRPVTAAGRYAATTGTVEEATAVGITTGAAAAGQALAVQSAGILEFSGWSWTTGARIYLGAGGTLTAVPPVTGWLVATGIALSATTMLVKIEQPINL